MASVEKMIKSALELAEEAEQQVPNNVSMVGTFALPSIAYSLAAIAQLLEAQAKTEKKNRELDLDREAHRQEWEARYSH